MNGGTMRFDLRTLAGLVVGAVVLAGTLTPATAAVAGTQPETTGQDVAHERAGSARTIPYVPNEASVRDVDATGFTVVIKPSCALAYQCLSYLRIPSVGISRGTISAANGYRVSWPASWAEGQSRSDAMGYSAAVDVFGNWWWNSARGKSLGTITRPYAARRLTATVSSVDAPGRSALLRGTATPGAEISVAGNRVATVDQSGGWSGRVSGLRPGRNDLTVVQRISGRDHDQVGVRVTITDGITARVTGQDDTARTARVEGTATPGAAVRLDSTQVATASSSGSWAATVTGLAIGPNQKTFTQFVGGTAAGSASVTITIADPGSPDRIVGQPGTAELVRGATGVATATFTAESAVTTPTGSATFTAPAGTTFATGQKALRGQVLRDGVWQDLGRNTLVRGERANGGRTYTYALAERDPGLAAQDRFRFSIRIDVPEGLSAASGVLTARMAGSVAAGTFDTTARTTTTFRDAEAPFTAAVTFPDDVSERAVLGGRGEPGARVDVREGSTPVAATTVRADGTWSLRLTPPDAGGVRDLVAEQTIGTAPAGSVPVRVDYGVAVRITSPGDGYQISPVFPAVRVSGVAAPRSRIVVTEQGTTTTLGTATADATGRWAIRTPPLGQRDHTLLATATGPGANTTTATVSLVPSG